MQKKEVTKVTDKILTRIMQALRLHLYEKTKVTIEWKVIVRDAKTLNPIQTIIKKNVITSGGLGLFASAIATPFVTGVTRFYWYLVLGTGAGVPAAADTALFTAVAASSKHGSITNTGPQYQYYVRYLPEDANGYTYTEAGIYDGVTYTGSTPDAYTAGTLLNHLMLSPTLAKDATKLVDFYVTVTFS